MIQKVEKELNTYNLPIILNEFIKGREFPIGIIGNDEDITVLPIKEVDLSQLPADLAKFYSFKVKAYHEDKTLYHIPAPLTQEEKFLIESISIKAYKALSLKDYARVDVIFKNNIPYVLEINSLPGLMRSKSSLYRMAEAT